MPCAARLWMASTITGATSKSMSATHIGRMSRPAYFCHFCESVPRRSGGLSKLNVMGGQPTTSIPGFRTFSVSAPPGAPGSGPFEERDDPRRRHEDQALVGDPDLRDDGKGNQVETHVGQGAAGGPPRPLEPCRRRG